MLNKVLARSIKVIAVNAKLIDSLRSPLILKAVKGPYVMLYFYSNGDKPAPLGTVWIPVRENNATSFIFSSGDGDSFFTDPNVIGGYSIRIHPLIGTNTRHCNSLRIRWVSATLVRNNIGISTLDFYSEEINLNAFGAQVGESNNLVVNVKELECNIDNGNSSLVFADKMNLHAKLEFDAATLRGIYLKPHNK